MAVKRRGPRRVLRAVALLIAAAATAAGLAGSAISASSHHVVADNGVIHSQT